MRLAPFRPTILVERCCVLTVLLLRAGCEATHCQVLYGVARVGLLIIMTLQVCPRSSNARKIPVQVGPGWLAGGDRQFATCSTICGVSRVVRELSAGRVEL